MAANAGGKVLKGIATLAKTLAGTFGRTMAVAAEIEATNAATSVAMTSGRMARLLRGARAGFKGIGTAFEEGASAIRRPGGKFEVKGEIGQSNNQFTGYSTEFREGGANFDGPGDVKVTGEPGAAGDRPKLPRPGGFGPGLSEAEGGQSSWSISTAASSPFRLVNWIRNKMVSGAKAIGSAFKGKVDRLGNLFMGKFNKLRDFIAPGSRYNWNHFIPGWREFAPGTRPSPGESQISPGGKFYPFWESESQAGSELPAGGVKPSPEGNGAAPDYFRDWEDFLAQGSDGPRFGTPEKPQATPPAVLKKVPPAYEYHPWRGKKHQSPPVSSLPKLPPWTWKPPTSPHIKWAPLPEKNLGPTDHSLLHVGPVPSPPELNFFKDGWQFALPAAIAAGIAGGTSIGMPILATTNSSGTEGQQESEDKDKGKAKNKREAQDEDGEQPRDNTYVRDAMADAFAMDSAQNAGFVGAEALAVAGQGGPFIITSGGPPGSPGARSGSPSLRRRYETWAQTYSNVVPLVDEIEAYVSGPFGSVYARDGALQLANDAAYTWDAYWGPFMKPFNVVFGPKDTGDAIFSNFKNAAERHPVGVEDPPSEHSRASHAFASIIALPLEIGLGFWNRNLHRRGVQKLINRWVRETSDNLNNDSAQRRDVPAPDENHEYDLPLAVTHDRDNSSLWHEASTGSTSQRPQLEPRRIRNNREDSFHREDQRPHHQDLQLATLVKYDEATITKDDLPYLQDLHIATIQPGRILLGDVLGPNPWTSHGYISGLGDFPTEEGWKSGELGFYLPNHGNLITGRWVSTIIQPHADVQEHFMNQYLMAQANPPALFSMPASPVNITGSVPSVANNLGLG